MGIKLNPNGQNFEKTQFRVGVDRQGGTKSPLETKRLLEEKHQHDICETHECTTLFQDSLQ